MDKDNSLYSIACKVIKDCGRDVISDKKFVNILNDYHAFADNQPLKYVVKVIIENGFTSKWLNIADDNEANLAYSKDVHIISSQFGLKDELVEEAVRTLFVALGYSLYAQDDALDEGDSDKQRNLMWAIGVSDLMLKCSNYRFYHYAYRDGNPLKKDKKGVCYSMDGRAVIGKEENLELRSYTIKKGTAYIADGAFENNEKDSIESFCIKIPDSVVAIGRNAFENANVESISIPESVKYIGDAAFKDNVFLTEVKLPESLEFIGSKAFKGTSINTIILPRNLKMIYGCDAFPQNTEIINQSLFLSYKDGILYNKDATILIACFSSEKVIHIAETVELIGCEAFLNNKNLEEVYLSGNVKRVGSQAFFGCGNLKRVECNSQLEVIEDEAFSECFNLRSFTLPIGVKELWQGAFFNTDIAEFHCLSPHVEYIDGLLYDKTNETLIAYFGKEEKVVIKESTEVIGYGAFFDNEHIKTVVLPKSLLQIESCAFQGCSELRRINVNTKKCEVNYDAFRDTPLEEKFEDIYS